MKAQLQALRVQVNRWLGRDTLPDDAPEHLKSGLWGEEHAAKFLQEHGYKILGRRVLIGRHDELDLVARHKEQIVFVEVKTRRSENYGRPLSAVDRKKRYRMSRAAVRYLKKVKTRAPIFRFDVIEVVGRVGDADPKLTHIESAFSLDSRFTYP